MAVLTRKSEPPERHYVKRSHTLGRSPDCKLQLQSNGASSYHALIRWRGDTWWVKDWDSTNGTFHNGVALPKNGSAALSPGDELRFGTEDETWLFTDASAPEAMLVPEPSTNGPKDEEPILLKTMWVFPNSDTPRITIFRTHRGTYAAESSDNGQGKQAELTDGQLLTFDERQFRLHLPGEDYEKTMEAEIPGTSVHDVELEMLVAPNEESALVHIRSPALATTLSPRAHLYTLLHLARLRIRDTQQRLADGQMENLEANVGWLLCDSLCDELRIARERIDSHVFRIRDAFRDAGVSDPVQIVDRSRRGCVRIGVPASRLKIGKLS